MWRFMLRSPLAGERCNCEALWSGLGLWRSTGGNGQTGSVHGIRVATYGARRGNEKGRADPMERASRTVVRQSAQGLESEREKISSHHVDFRRGGQTPA